MQLMVGDTEKEKVTKSMYKRSQEGKKRTRESAKKKARCGESSQARYKLHDYAHFYVRLNHSPS